MKKEKAIASKSNSKKLQDFNFNFNSLIENEIEIEKEKTLQKLKNKKENEIEKELKENEKLSKKEKELLKDLLIKFKNSELKEKGILIKKIEFNENDIKKLNELLLKFIKWIKRKKSFNNLKDSKLYSFNNNKKDIELLYFQNWKSNKKYINNLKNENEKILYNEYIKINNIWKNEKDLIKWIEYEKMKYDLILKYCNNFENELKKKNSQDIKLLNSYFIKSNISKNIKNSKLIYSENIENNNIYWKNNNNYEWNYINKINNKYIIEIIEKEKEKELQKIKSFINSIENLKSEYNLQVKNKKEYINKFSQDIINKCNRIYKNYINKYWIENELIKQDILKLYEKELKIIKNVNKSYYKNYNEYNLQYKNLQNKINYNSKNIKSEFQYLLSE